ncbi:MAG: CDP-alcohol phosphatidyltransferase family protein [Verrucomicrobiales bacterium]|nr:CDP-alcohol phosphatidyltransferase family protein [Verrucomicrobiales bacterium]
MNEKRPTVNCYSKGEGGFMTRSQDLRAAWLRPLLHLLGRNGIRAGHITLLSLLFGLAFCPFFIAESYFWAFGFLLIHVVLDGIDGPLARFQKKAGNRGSFTDTSADQLVVTATTITLIYNGLADPWPAGWYVFLYTVVVVFAMIRNAMSTPYSWLFRPRFPVFLWIAVEVFWLPGTLNYILWAGSATLAVKALTGFITIRRNL